MHNFEPKIVDLTSFTNIGDTLMKKEFVYMGNTSSIITSTLPFFCVNARYAFRPVVYKYDLLGYYDKLNLRFF